MHNEGMKYEAPHSDVTKNENVAKGPNQSMILIHMILITYEYDDLCYY